MPRSTGSNCCSCLKTWTPRNGGRGHDRLHPAGERAQPAAGRLAARGYGRPVRPEGALVLPAPLSPAGNAARATGRVCGKRPPRRRRPSGLHERDRDGRLALPRPAGASARRRRGTSHRETGLLRQRGRPDVFGFVSRLKRGGALGLMGSGARRPVRLRLALPQREDASHRRRRQAAPIPLRGRECRAPNGGEGLVPGGIPRAQEYGRPC